MKENKETPPPPVLPSQPAGAEAKSWHEHRRKTEQETPQRLEDAAKFIGSAQALSLSLFLGVLDKQESLSAMSGWLIVSLLAWLGSVLASLLVVFPMRWRHDAESAESIRAAHGRMVSWKYGLLTVSAVLYLGALVAAVCGVLGW